MSRYGCMGLILWAVWALCAQASPSLPPEMTQISAQRDARCSHWTFLWRMEFSLDKDGAVQRASATFRLARWQGLTHVQLITHDAKTPPEPLSPWSGYYGDGWGLRCKPVFLMGGGRVYPKWIALVYRCPGNGLYYEATVPREMYEPHPLEFSILAGADFAKVMDASWTVRYQDTRFWVLEGTYQLPPFHVPAYLRIRLRKEDGAPAAIERYSERWHYRVNWQVERYRRVSGILLPAEVRAVWQTRPDARHELPNKRAVFRLVSVGRTPQPVGVDMPAGTPVQDFRLIDYWNMLNVVGVRMADEEFVDYRWQGQLPDENALRTLALQQGKLPGGRARIRAAWVIFLPGLLLLAVAWYFYRRMRRTV